MSIYEYNEEYVRKVMFEDGMEKGLEKGMEEGYNRGITDGENRLSKLIAILMEQGNNDIVIQVTQDESIRHKYYEKYGI